MSAFSKQPNAQMCFVCGQQNPIGLHMCFYADEAGRVVGRFTPQKKHEGYPGIMHGGLVTAILDEVMGRAAIATENWATTAKLAIRFKRPVPILKELTAVGEVISRRRNVLELKGAIFLEDGRPAAEATGTFFRLEDGAVDEMLGQVGIWDVIPDEEPPDFLERIPPEF